MQPVTNEQRAATAFSKQSFVFDQIYADDLIVNYKRERVRAHLQQYLSPNSSILELNSGTGEDAIWLAQQGHRVHATDISTGMQEALAVKTKAAGVADAVSQEICSFTSLHSLHQKGPYDLVFSNFAGLNCTGELARVLHSLPALVNPDGIVTLVILPRFCLWEFLLLFRGKFRTALRRFSGRRGTVAKVEGESFRCWYYNPDFVIKELSSTFHLLSVEGLCTLVPPSYISHFAERYGRVYRWLTKLEKKYKHTWPWRVIGDYYIITLQKR